MQLLALGAPPPLLAGAAQLPCPPCLLDTAQICKFPTSLLLLLLLLLLLQIRGKVSAVLDGVWWVLWLIAAAVATSIIVDSGNSRTRASCAFCWITW